MLQNFLEIVATKITDRPGGYTRIIRLSNRIGDNSKMCFIELVDYNEVYVKDTVDKKSKEEDLDQKQNHKVKLQKMNQHQKILKRRPH